MELAFALKAPLEGRNVTVGDALSTTICITPAAEIIDACVEEFDRHTQAMRKEFDTIGDPAGHRYRHGRRQGSGQIGHRSGSAPLL